MPLLLLLLLRLVAEVSSTHHGCEADTADPSVYSCNYQNWPSLPVKMWPQNKSDFPVPIRKLRIYNIDQYIDDNQFKDFSVYPIPDDTMSVEKALTDAITALGLATGSITTNFRKSSLVIDQMREPELELQCISSGRVFTMNDHFQNSPILRTNERGYLILKADSFVGLQWVRRLSIIDCQMSGGNTNPFRELVNITSFRFLGGVWNDMSLYSLRGMNIYNTEVQGSGTVEITGEFPFNILFFFMLDPLSNARRLIVKGNRMNRIHITMLQKFTELEYLDMSHNEFYYLPSTLFDNSKKLGFVRLEGIRWYCYCVGGWFFSWALENNVELWGEFLCEYPSEYRGVNYKDYFANNCNGSAPIGVTIAGPPEDFISLPYLILYSLMAVVAIADVIIIVIAVRLMKIRQKKYDENIEKSRNRRKINANTATRDEAWK